MRFHNREHAGEQLGELVEASIASINRGIVLGLPRGGVPVASGVAAHLDLPLDIYLVRKLGVPGHEEYAMGAIASGGVMVLNDDAIERLRITSETVEAVATRERAELERRERLYRGDRPPLDVAGRDVILVDDGIATGSSMRAAIESVTSNAPSSVVVAVPVAPRSAEGEFAPLVDRYLVVHTPRSFQAVGMWYRDFTQTSDDEVRFLLST